jgi:hypothetical protein
MPFSKLNQFHECKQATATTKNRQSLQQPARRFSPPWSVEEQAACFGAALDLVWLK